MNIKYTNMSQVLGLVPREILMSETDLKHGKGKRLLKRQIHETVATTDSHVLIFILQHTIKSLAEDLRTYIQVATPLSACLQHFTTYSITLNLHFVRS